MTAPALVLLGSAGSDARVAEVSQEIRRRLIAIRPELTVAVGFVGADPTGPGGRELGRLAGASEVVVVPLLLSDAFHAQPQAAAWLTALQRSAPDVRATIARPIGPEAQLLSVLDRRLRDALRVRRVAELDGLVFAAAGSTDIRSNALVARRARQWSAHHRLPSVTSFATGSGPSTAEAIRTLRAQGRRHIAVGGWFLSPGPLYTHQADLALDAGATAVSEPMGGEPEIAEVVLTRYVVSAMELVDLEHVPATPFADLDLDEDFVPVRHLSVVSA